MASAHLMSSETQLHLNPELDQNLHWSYPSKLMEIFFPLWMSIGCFTYNSNTGACSKVVFESEWRATHFRSLRAKLIFAHLACCLADVLCLHWTRALYFWRVVSSLDTSTTNIDRSKRPFNIVHMSSCDGLLHGFSCTISRTQSIW
jgi:hypothetical protein